MKTFAILTICAVLSVCMSMGVYTEFAEPEASSDTAPAPAEESAASSASSSASDSSSSSASDSSSDSSASDSASSSASDSSSSSSSASASAEATEVMVKRDTATALLRRFRRAGATPVADLSPVQLESLSEVCEVSLACDDMAETAGIVAAYVAYYGPVPF